MSREGLKHLTEEEMNTLCAFFECADGKVDKEKFAEKIGLNKNAAAMRLYRLKQKFTKTSQAESQDNTQDSNTAKVGNKRKANGGNPRNEKAANGSKRKKAKSSPNDEGIVNGTDGEDSSVSVKQEDTGSYA